MKSSHYSVSVSTPLREVVAKMAEGGHVRAVIQLENGESVGYFTAADALRILADILDNEASIRLDVGTCLSVLAIQRQHKKLRLGWISRWLSAPTEAKLCG